MTNPNRTALAELISDLKQQRDEIRVRLHLGGQEIKDEWDKLDDKLNELNHRFDPLKDAMEETAGDVWSSMKLVAEEIKQGFHRIKEAI